MPWPVDARNKKLKRRYPDQDIWDLLLRGVIDNVPDWLHEEIACRGWSLEQAAYPLKTNQSHLSRIVRRISKASKEKVIVFAAAFGYACDEGDGITDKIDCIVVLMGYPSLGES